MGLRPWADVSALARRPLPGLRPPGSLQDTHELLELSSKAAADLAGWETQQAKVADMEKEMVVLSHEAAELAVELSMRRRTAAHRLKGAMDSTLQGLSMVGARGGRHQASVRFLVDPRPPLLCRVCRGLRCRSNGFQRSSRWRRQRRRRPPGRTRPSARQVRGPACPPLRPCTAILCSAAARTGSSCSISR